MRISIQEEIKRLKKLRRLTANPNFCSWFSGLFEGKGCLDVNYYPEHRKRKKLKSGKIREYTSPHWNVGIVIELTSKDFKILQDIRQNLGVGHVNLRGGKARYYCHRLEDLSEVIIPLFEEYPLRTARKNEQYRLWKEIVIIRYKRKKQRGKLTEKDLKKIETLRKEAKVRRYLKGKERKDK